MDEITKIKDLTPSSRRVNVIGKVVVLGEPKEIKTRFGEDKSVSEVVVADDTGKITLTLWDDQVKDIRDGETLKIDNGYISLLRGHMRLNVGKYGSMAEAEEGIEPNEELDMSEKEYEYQYNNYNNRYGNQGNRGDSNRGNSNRGYGNNNRRSNYKRNEDNEE
ncbi:single-stranded DNA-binding protein [Ferroplasma sp.]|uniref:single-stranded DNA-binding protein n=1 Tax=Ferroplasma sp. TaxID=2591003 RepID=UPI00262925CA|nr:single-stranded DNA-binding protein [Ferroplasma sp.]